MKTIVLANQKGGVGKTTLALHLAAAFNLAGKETLVYDLDPQVSAAEWYDDRMLVAKLKAKERGEENPEPPAPYVESIVAARLSKSVETAREIGAEILVIDTPPKLESAIIDAAEAADLILLPSGVSFLDIRALRTTAKLLRAAKKRPTYVVLNAVAPRGREVDDAAEAIESDPLIELPVCPLRIVRRNDFYRCLIDGETAQEYAPKGDATREAEALYKWTCELLNI